MKRIITLLLVTGLSILFFSSVAGAHPIHQTDEIVDYEVFDFNNAAKEAFLTQPFSWGESTVTEGLQFVLGVEVDGHYGPGTRDAHVALLNVLGLDTSNVPSEVVVSVPVLEEGAYQDLVEATFAALPAPLYNAVQGLEIINGCNEELVAQLGRCTYGAFSLRHSGIWVSNKGVNSGHLKDIVTHEAGHAWDYLVLARCTNPETGNSYSFDLRNSTGNSEMLADAIVEYFTPGGWQHYRGGGSLTEQEYSWFKAAEQNC